MPLYDYDCAACGRRFEVIHGVHADGPTACPLCGAGPVRKAITAAAIHYKGSGWAKKERRASTAGGSAKGAADTQSDSSSDATGGTGTAAGGDDGGGSNSADTATTKTPTTPKTAPSATAGSNRGD